MGRAVVRTSQRVANRMGKLMFDEVRHEPEDFVEDSPSHGPEAVPGHGASIETHCSEGDVDGVLAHRPLRAPGARKDELAPLDQRVQVSK